MSHCPPQPARYREALKIASVGLSGSATPSPFASVPHRAQVEGMNCIQPTAPAELGPRLLPKLVSTLLIAPSTSHGMPYRLPAACQMTRRAAKAMGPFCAWLNEITGPPEGPVELGPLACDFSTRNVSAEAVLEAASASTAASSGTKRLMATAGRRRGVSAAPRPPRPSRPRTAPAPRRPRPIPAQARDPRPFRRPAA